MSVEQVGGEMIPEGGERTEERKNGRTEDRKKE
jgi:hypothetical protein